ncbi:hypothetical protein [Microbulbifer marinus]|uniref:hypothetical protein n=1 Tax=Microbulbifer marinus TaxID=658218 RepID=UPI00111538C2|nr:hypothetical protein [Microbulbifer marinus]
MENKEIYDGLRLIAQTYISDEKKDEILIGLDQCEKEGRFPPGKWVLASVDSHSNGVGLKREHKELWSDICYHCV